MIVWIITETTSKALKKMQSLILVAIFVAAHGAHLPSYLKKCKQGPESRQCLVENAKSAVDKLKVDGEPVFKLQHLSPVKISAVELEVTAGLKISIKDVKLYGFDDITISSGTVSENRISGITHINRQMEVVGDYDMDGKIFILPIRGSGLCNLTFVDFDLEFDGNFTKIERKGKTYLKLTNEDTKLTMYNMKRVYWQFDNLFDGDKRLAPEMNNFLNENWKAVFDEMKPALEETAAAAIINYYINGFLHYIPLDDLFL